MNKTKSDARVKSIKFLGISIYQSKKSFNKHYRRLLGIPYWSAKIKNGKKKKYFLGVCYSRKKIKTTFSPWEQSVFSSMENIQKSLMLLPHIKAQNDYIAGQNDYIAGQNDCIASKSSINEVYQAIEQAKLQSNTFSKYKNIYKNKDIVLVATGPTINFYKPLKDAVHIGVNRAFCLEKISLDYLFMQDYAAVSGYIENVSHLPCKKFYGIIPPSWSPKIVIPESIAIKHQAERYYIEVMIGREIAEPLPYDISVWPFKDWGSVILPTAQFALYTNPRRIYLTGCDTSNAGYFDKTQPIYPLGVDSIIYGWKKIKEMAAIYYPETEIISVNPVGLKGIFKDVYTEEYLNEHPEIDRTQVEILEEK